MSIIWCNKNQLKMNTPLLNVEKLAVFCTFTAHLKCCKCRGLNFNYMLWLIAINTLQLMLEGRNNLFNKYIKNPVIDYFTNLTCQNSSFHQNNLKKGPKNKTQFSGSKKSVLTPIRSPSIISGYVYFVITSRNTTL